MNSRELIRNTIEFKNPERVAISFDNSDIQYSSYHTKTNATDWIHTEGATWERTDEWGNTWRRIDETSKGEVVKGVLDNVEDIKNYIFPDFSLTKDYVKTKQKREQMLDKWVMGSLPGFAFNIARKMRKLDEYLMDLLTERELMAVLHDKIDDMLEQMIIGYANAGLDAIMITEDWGTQNQTLISPTLWREEFFPRFKKLCKLAHDRGLKVFMHSCGKIEAIIPGLIEAGIDVLQFDQPDLHGIDQLASYQENANITFWGPVDIQKTLQTKDSTIITNKAKEMLDKLWKGRGGFIAGYYTDNESIGLSPCWQELACKEFVREGRKENYELSLIEN